MQNSPFLAWLRKSYIFIIIALIYIPLIVVVLLSFTKPSIKGNVTNGFDWNDGSNFIELFKNSQFTNALLNTFIVTIFVVPISVIIATITCFGIWHSRKIYKNSILITSKTNIVIPDVITGICLALLFSITWLGWFKQQLGFVTIILSHISFCTPYAILIIYPRMEKMKNNLILASQDLGYSKIKTFFNIIIPFLMPTILASATIVFGMSFDDFIITKLVGGKVNTISTEMYSMAKGIKMWAVTFGAILVLCSFIIIIIVAARKAIKSKISIEKRDKRKWKKVKRVY